MKPMSIKSAFLWGGISCLVFGVIIVGAGAWDTFFRVGRQTQVVEAPGFHVLDLETPGVYAGIYQHRGDGPIPVEALSRLDVRLSAKETYQEVPVMMNKSAQVFSQLGVRAVLVCNFLIEKPGFYTLSATYTGDNGPAVSLLLVPQSAQSVRPMLAGGALFFLIFTGLGIYLIRQSRRF